MNQNDKRARKTKKALHEAMMELLTEKSLSHISVTELTERADVHRVTFYAHYQDINELYDELTQTVLDDTSIFVDADTYHSYEEHFDHVAGYFNEHRHFCQLLFTDNELLEKAMDIWNDNYLKIWLDNAPLSKATEEMRYMTAYNIEGSMAIIREWWRDGFSVPKDHIVGYLCHANRIFDTISLTKS